MADAQHGVRIVLLSIACLLTAPGFGSAQSDDQWMVLALSWQPAFCETRPDRPECRTQSAERIDATQFSLHGLWPQPRGRHYCGQAADLQTVAWSRLPEPPINTEVRADLKAAMPGMQSLLHRHQWAKHGHCTGFSADDYFQIAMALMAEINASPFGDWVFNRIGTRVETPELMAAFDAVFGSEASDRMHIQCRTDGNRTLIVELQISMMVGLEDDRTIGDRMVDAPQQKPRRNACSSGVIDPAGLQ